MSVDPELNLFTSDPELLRPAEDAAYERAAHELCAFAGPERLRILHALVVGENTAQRAAVWSGLPQTLVERELAAMQRAGVVARETVGPFVTYQPRDGHVVVLVHVAIAHARDAAVAEPRLLARRARRARALARAG